MSTASAVSRPRAGKRRGRIVAMAAALLVYGAFSPPASAMEGAGTGVAGTHVLEAADHAELSAGIASSGVVRIALEGDRIARAVRGAGRFGIEHDPANGDLYLRPLDNAAGETDRSAEAAAMPEAAHAVPAPAVGPAVPAPAVLFVGTEKGFTYRLILTPVAGGPAQVLIRNPAVANSAPPPTISADRRIGALVRLVRAAARREPLAGYAVHAGGAAAGMRVPGTRVPGLTVIETWRGPRFSALVFEAGPSASEGAEGAADLAGTIGGLPGIGRTGDGVRLAALWLAAPGAGPSGGRLGVAAFADIPAADPHHAGDFR